MLTPFSDHLVSAQDLLIICTNCTILQITLLFCFELILPALNYFLEVKIIVTKDMIGILLLLKEGQGF